MKQNGRGNTLLVELLIVVLFFMLAATTLMELFGAAKQNSARASAYNAALLQTQNMAETLYAAENMPQTLENMGFAKDENGWHMDCGEYSLTAQYVPEDTQAGTLQRVELTALYRGEALFALPATRYQPEEVQP